MVSQTTPSFPSRAPCARDQGIAIELTGVSKRYGAFSALKNINLSIGQGEFLAIVGSSGSGKSTLLMALAGFVSPDEGSIGFKGRNIAQVPANARGFGVVFQNYALFPHMTVAQNVMFPLRVRGLPRAEAEKRARAAIGTVKLAGLEDRHINELSGGQRQRVALARAIVYEPSVLLMDEPLSALDKSLREEMQMEIRELQNKLNITTLYVTHDQREALTMADRVAVMSQGEIVQIDTPERIYRAPANVFVARFLGEAILFDRQEAKELLRSDCQDSWVSEHDVLMVRSEDLQLDRPDAATVFTLSGRVHAVVFQGDSWLIQVECSNRKMISVRAQRASQHSVSRLDVGDPVELHVASQDIHGIRGRK